MPFRFTEVFPMLYPQYFDEATDKPLLADPQGVYDMRCAGTWDVPIPPQDGRWQPVEDEPDPEPEQPESPEGESDSPDMTADAPPTPPVQVTLPTAPPQPLPEPSGDTDPGQPT